MTEMRKQAIRHLELTIGYAEALLENSERDWRTPVETGKWTVAEVIGHLIPWDEFVLYNRIPYFTHGERMPKSPDAEQVNSRASIDSQKRTIEETIRQFIQGRQMIIHALLEIDERLWEKEFVIGSISQYLKGLAQHDQHHFDQIQNVLSRR